ncbi:MAG: PRC-barrel domain-containing protein [Candidatus Woesearchaeota archaeon]
MLRMKRISETYNMRVFTEDGDYFGDVEEALLGENKVSGWRIRATRGSYLSKIVGNAKGVIVPHQLVKNIGDIMLISRQAVPNYKGSEEEE